MLDVSNRDRGADLAAGDVVITGLTVVGGYGWATPVGRRVGVVIASEKVIISPVPFEPTLTESPFSKLIGFEFAGGASTTGGGFIGGGLGVSGALEGMLVASALNAATTRTTVNTLVRMSGVDGEVAFHHGTATPDTLRNLFAKAANTVAGGQAHQSSGPADLASQLERLVELFSAGHLTAEEFAAAKQRAIDSGT